MKSLRHLFSGFIFTSFITSLVGCTSYGVIDNPPLNEVMKDEGYSWYKWSQNDHHEELDIVLSFSGGGTRAAALSYGVLKGLRDSNIVLNGKSIRLLDAVDQISSVSGGSFTSAYYGLNGDGIFDTYTDDFLTRDVEQHLFWGLLNPIEWFRSGGRTEMAIRYYNEVVFHNASFSDMRKDGPFIVINASGLGNGVRFSFIQEYFNLFCSDMTQYPVAKAVAASSSVPIVFLPVVLEKYPGCTEAEPEWLKSASERAEKNDDFMLKETVRGMSTLFNKERLRYIHLVDGGITDNLGLHALYDFISLSGGAKETVHNIATKPAKYFVVLSVNSSTDPNLEMDLSNEEPAISEIIGAMSSIQLHRYNSTTLKLMDTSLKKWTEAISTPEHEVKSYFITIGLNDIVKPELRLLFNKIPTSFGLSHDTVDYLVKTGEELLRNDSEYQRLISDLKADQAKKH